MNHGKHGSWLCQWDGCPHTATRWIRRGESSRYLSFCTVHTLVYRNATVGFTPPLRSAKRVVTGG